MAPLALVLTSGWASGVNAYGVVVMMGLLGRFGGIESVPPELQRPGVLALAGGMYAVEFVTDKIPYVDSAWDVLSTLVRPTVGGMVAYLIAGEAQTVDQAWYAVAGGTAAFASHLVKAALRLAVNTSPEPVTNVTVSLGEDITVAALITLALYHPWVALGIASTLFVIGLLLVIVLFRLVVRGWRRRRERRAVAAGA